MSVGRYVILLISVMVAIAVITGCPNPAGPGEDGANGGENTETGDGSNDGSGDGSNGDALNSAEVAFFRADAARDDVVAVMNDGTQQTILFQLRADDLHADGDTNEIYWLDAEHYKIQRVGSDGTALEALITSSDALEDARGFAIDTGNDTMYWIRVQNAENHLMRANLDGSAVEQLTTLSGDPNDVAVAGSAGYVFVSTGSGTDAEVTRFNLDGTSSLTLAAAADGVRIAQALAVDSANSTVYWIDGETTDSDPQSIDGVAFDGSGSVETLHEAGTYSNIADLAVAPQGNYVYWVDRGYEQLARIGTAQGADDESLASSVRYSALAVTGSGVYVYEAGDTVASFGDQPGMISSTEVDGTNVAEVIRGTSISGPERIAFDAASKTIYWTEGDTIKSAGLDGREAEIVVDSSAGAADPSSVVIDSDNAHLYWSNGNSPLEIYRSGLDGSSPITVLTSSEIGGVPVDVLVDANGGFIYWADDDGLNETVRRGKLDGTGIETVVSDAFGVTGIDVDTSADTVYWSVALIGSGDKVARANLDGTGEETVVSDPADPAEVAVDVGGGHIYWSEGGSGYTPIIGRANLDGTASEDFVTTGLSLPTGIAVW